MFRRNIGRFNKLITLKKPSAPKRDKMGGLETSEYETVRTVFAMCEKKSQTRQPFVGDYVTSDTRYFVVRDIRSLCPGIDTSWQLVYNGFTFRINELTLMDDSAPYYIQITATAMNGSGGIV